MTFFLNLTKKLRTSPHSLHQKKLRILTSNLAKKVRWGAIWGPHLTSVRCLLKYAFALPVGHPPSLFFLTLRSTSINTIAKPFDNLNGRLGTLESATIHQTVGFTDTAKFGFKGWARSVKPEQRRSSHLLLLLLEPIASLLSKAKNGKRGFFWIYLLISDLWRKRDQKKFV